MIKNLRFVAILFTVKNFDRFLLLIVALPDCISMIYNLMR